MKNVFTFNKRNNVSHVDLSIVTNSHERKDKINYLHEMPYTVGLYLLCKDF